MLDVRAFPGYKIALEVELAEKLAISSRLCGAGVNPKEIDCLAKDLRETLEQGSSGSFLGQDDAYFLHGQNLTTSVKDPQKHLDLRIANPSLEYRERRSAFFMPAQT